ncbi:MAG TPA: phenylalanine--tRNA ligase subunit alpha [Chloroflexota bacterium]|nr:phenylalanine--tRNA ligase subunit alpha [Chloroflexota bacterium]
MSTTTSMIDELETIEKQALAHLAGASDQDALEEWRVKVLSRSGQLANAMRRLGAIPKEDRPAAGAAANRVKTTLEQAFAERQAALRAEARARALEGQRIDVTLPARGFRIGQVHPITRIRREVERAFMRLGFSVVEGPEVEWDRYNFTLLNMPPDHPARDIQDTFYVENVGNRGGESDLGEVILRTHTSPVQIRTMLDQRPPIRVIAPGKVYRNEATDASHEAMFSQVEGLCVDEHTTMGDLRGSLTFMIRSIFGAEREVRFRCGYFPFVEPGAEFDMTCHVCGGSGCRVCKNTGWIEIGGCGMVHPKVLENVGIDASRYTGWAFGFGFERLALLRYGVDDIRLFYGNDLRFLRQFA